MHTRESFSRPEMTTDRSLLRGNPIAITVRRQGPLVIRLVNARQAQRLVISVLTKQRKKQMMYSFPLAPFSALLQQFAMGNAQRIRLLDLGIGVCPHDPELTADATRRNSQLIVWKPPLHVLQDWNHLLPFLGVVRPGEATLFAEACFFAVQGAYRDPLSLSRVALDCAAQQADAQCVTRKPSRHVAKDALNIFPVFPLL